MAERKRTNNYLQNTTQKTSILLTYLKHLYDHHHITKRGCRGHNFLYPLPHIFEVSIPSQESEFMVVYSCVGLSILARFTISPLYLFFFLFFFHWILIYILLQHGMSFSFLTEISKLGKPEYPGKTTHREFPKFPDQLSSITASYREDLTHNIRKVWRYQKCDHSEFKEEHTIQWSKEKQTMVEQHKTH